MRFQSIWWFLIIGIVLLPTLSARGSAQGSSQAAIALEGQVSSAEEGAMEGVLVTARRAGANFTVTVVSDDKGQYRFLRKNLQPGEYSLQIRAAGYEFDGLAKIEVRPSKTATADLKLGKTKNLAAQLTTAEWLQSVPGTHAQKLALLGCGSCHSVGQIVMSRHTAAEWLQVFDRMSGYEPESSMARAQRVPKSFVLNDAAKQQAEYLSTINLSATDKWAFPLKTLPRPKGRATHVVVTEYELPKPDAVPHDVAVDPNGAVWYADSESQYLGKFDPKTNKFAQYPISVFDPNETVGTVEVQIDKSGNVWTGLMEQGSKIARFDPQTEKFTYWDLLKPGEQKPKGFLQPRVAFIMPFHDDVDGGVWTTDLLKMYRVNVRSGQVDRFDVFEKMPGGPRGHLIYQVVADSKNNGYFLEWTGGGVGRVDAKTGEVSFYPTPTPNSFSRRGHFDEQDLLWFDEFFADRIAMFDTHTNKIQEWQVPNAWTAPYDVAPDNKGEIWASGLSSDRLLRFNPKTGQYIEYLLPRYTDARRISLDYSNGKMAIWLPNKNRASIIKIEPLD